MDVKTLILQALSFLVLAVYPGLLGYPGWVLYRRTREMPYTPWIVGLPDDQQKLARIVGGVFTLTSLFFVIGIFITQMQFGVELTLSVLVTTLVAGGCAQLVGLVRWRADQALWMRVIGWMLMTGILIIPSSLTLMLPLVAPLMLLMHRIPEEPAAVG